MRCFLEPNNAVYLSLLGNIKDVQKKPQEALEYYKKALAIQPKNPYVHFNIGVLYRNQNLPDKMLEAFEEGLKYQKNLGVLRTVVEMSLRRASYYYHQKNYKKVKENLLRFRKYVDARHPKWKDVQVHRYLHI